jgi:hypothetical protein
LRATPVCGTIRRVSEVIVSERPAGLGPLLRSAWALLRGDRAVATVAGVWLALRGAVAAAAVVVSWLVPGRALGVGAAVVVVVLIVAWVAVGTYGQVALLAVLGRRLAGVPCRARDGFAVANARLASIARSVRAQRASGPYSWWTPRTAFTLTILATEDVDDDEAARRSEELHRARWDGARVDAEHQGTVVFGGLGVAVAVGFGALCVGDPVSIIGLCGALAIVVLTFTFARLLRALLALAIYRHQLHGVIAFGLTEAQLDGLVRPSRYRP